MTQTPLHLDWPGCLNARDLGGLPLAGGGTVLARALVRTDSLTYLTPEGVAAARAFGLARVVDLRRPSETARHPHPFADDPVYLNRPVQEPEDREDAQSWTDLYVGMLELRPQHFARAVAAVADAPDGPVAVHCAVGKDRTGLVVAMVLTLAGVPEEAVVADYLLSNERLAPRYAAERATAATRAAALARGEVVPDDVPAGAPDPERYVPPSAQVMADTLAHLRRAYGSVAGYLRSGGLGDAQREALVGRLTCR